MKISGLISSVMISQNHNTATTITHIENLISNLPNSLNVISKLYFNYVFNKILKNNYNNK